MTTSAQKPLENDDGRRPSRGVVVTPLDMEDGTSRIILDDATADPDSQETSWKHDTFYTHKRLSSTAIDDMALPASEYQGLGEAPLARLLALNGRVR
jgi:hypothetical protein